MRENKFIYSNSRHKLTHTYKLFRVLVVVGFICASLFSGLVSIATPTYAATMPGGSVQDPVKRAVALAKPAVVRIITNVKATLKVSFPPTTEVTFPQQSGQSYELQFSGSGAFISADGDILTAAHVINPPKDDELDKTLYKESAKDIAKYLNEKDSKTQVTPEQVVTQLTSKQLKSTATYEKAESTVFYNTDYSGKSNVKEFSQLPTELVLKVDEIKKESPASEQDLAIIHVNAPKDTLSIPMGDSNAVQSQDELTIIGFPGNADVSSNPDSLLTPSINSIDVSSTKQSNSGAPLIQVSGNVNRGDSGAPALDKEGKIVGVVSFGISEDGTNLSGTSFLQASSSANEMIKSIDLDTTPGQQQKLWQQSLTDYAATSNGHWTKAQQGFDQLLKEYTVFKAITPYRDYAQQQAKTENTSVPTVTPTQQATPTPTPVAKPAQNPSTVLASGPALAITIGVIALVVILGISLFAFSLRRRKKKGSEAIAQATASTPNTPTQSSTPNATTQYPTQSTLTMKAWPCGHMNRTTARFCSVCGEPAP